MPRSVRRSRHALNALSCIALGTLVALAGCAGAPSGQDSAPPTPAPGAPSAVPLTRQQAIARARDVTLRVEVTTCTGYQTGTGFLVGPRLIATAAHVVNGAQTVAVRGLHDESVGTIIGTDDERDVALIRTSKDVGVGDPLVFADKEPQQGDDIVAIGYPDGRPQTPTSGTVGRLGQSVDVDKRRLHDLVQFDAGISTGSSGGPLLDLRGAVVGMTAVPDDYAAGISYAVSSKTARPLVAAWVDSPAELIPSRCAHRSTAVTDRSDSADGPGIAFTLRGYYDSLNAAVETRDSTSGESLGHYFDAYEMTSGRLQKRYGSLDDFREDRLDVNFSKVRLVSARRMDEVTDSAEVHFRVKEAREGEDKCTYHHYRFQVRLASGAWKLDDRKPFADDGSRC